jgi:hypothetical protein
MPLVNFTNQHQLGEIVIDRPPLNLFSLELLADLRSAIHQATASDIRGLLVRAEGTDFSAGADVAVFIGLDETRAAELEETVLSLIASIEALPVPALALIHGQCYAGALEVCLACDLIWAAEGSQIGQIEAVAGGIRTRAARNVSRPGPAWPARPRWCSRELSCLRKHWRRGACSTASCRRTNSSRRAGPSRRFWQAGPPARIERRSASCTRGAPAELQRPIW